MTTENLSRADIVLAQLTDKWQAAGQIADKLSAARLDVNDVRNALNVLRGGPVQRSAYGNPHGWRLAPTTPPAAPPTVLSPDDAHVSAFRATVVSLAEALGVPLDVLFAPVSPLTRASIIMAFDDMDASDLSMLNTEVGWRLDKATAFGALKAVLDVLDGWIDGARENHVEMGHRDENTGEECWREFHVDDIRRMVNDAARDLDLPRMPYEPPADATS